MGAAVKTSPFPSFYGNTGRSSKRTPSRWATIRGNTRIGPWLEEQDRHREHAEEESEVGHREYPPTTAIDAIAKLARPPAIQRAHHQVDHDGRAHSQEAEVQEPVHQRDIRDAGQLLTHHELVGDGGQDADERDTEPIAERRPIHPEH